MCADRARAEELTQDAFVRAWERLSSFRGESRFSTWLHRLTVNVVLESTRADQRWHLRFLPEESVSDREARASTGPAGRIEARLDLERAVASLPPGARMVLVLRDIEGYRYREVAEMTGLAIGTVKAQIHRARRLLRERLSAGTDRKANGLSR